MKRSEVRVRRSHLHIQPILVQCLNIRVSTEPTILREYTNREISKVCFFCFCIFYLGSLSRPFTNHRLQGKEKGFSSASHYHFHPLHRHLDISRGIAAEISPLHIGSSRTITGNLWCPSETLSYAP